MTKIGHMIFLIMHHLLSISNTIGLGRYYANAHSENEQNEPPMGHNVIQLLEEYNQCFTFFTVA